MENKYLVKHYKNKDLNLVVNAARVTTTDAVIRFSGPEPTCEPIAAFSFKHFHYIKLNNA